MELDDRMPDDRGIGKTLAIRENGGWVMKVRDCIEYVRAFSRTLVRDERGASAIEYGLIAGLVAVGLVGALTLVGGNLSDTFDGIADALGSGDAPADP